MESHTPGSQTAQGGRITFAVERFAVGRDQVVVTGRWFGVRGRRFVRPTLTLALRSDGRERRALADLEHKPWAAEDGELWTAAFPLTLDLDDAEQVELSVAPDITVVLSTDGTSATATDQAGGGAAHGARAPRVRTERVPARPGSADRTRELERLRARLNDVEGAHGRERTRREAAERTLEEARAEALRLRSDVGRLRAELDLASTAQQELAAASTELEATRAKALSTSRALDTARNDARATARELDQARNQAREAARALKHARTQLEQTVQRLREAELERQRTEADRDAVSQTLEQERAETHRLRQELADAESAVRRLAQGAPVAPMAAASEPPPMALGELSAGPSPVRAPRVESETQPQRLEPMSARLRALNKLETSTPPWAERPLNPSLRPTDNRIVRALAVIVVLAAVVAVLLVIHAL